LRLGQILINLVSNAVKFTEQGKIIVSINPEKIEQHTICLKFSVQDSGIGMRPEQMANLFKSFSQGDSSTTRKYGGTGLGLMISRQLVELMGGHIWVESQLHKGSSFYFTVVLGIGTEQSYLIQRESVAPRTDFSGRCVLLVEDNEINREIAFELLSDLGVTVKMAENGEQAVERATIEKFDLIFMDIQMPEMDGLTATQLIRMNERLQDVPIIAMTAHAMSGDREKSLAAGMNDHITKPINSQKLAETLTYWLAGKTHKSTFIEVTPQEPLQTVRTDELPDSLPPFNIPAALERVRGRVKLLRKLLLLFHEQYSDAIPKLKNLLHEGQYEEAKRLVHTLKGVAMNLEVTELAEAAREVEQVLSENNLLNIENQINSLDSVLAVALKAVSSLEKN
jgi:CheY-like chemotaxis protein/HPt (histidine-containing phosphotransfer) domain-containing protein